VLLARLVMNEQRSMRRKAKRTYYIERVRECERVFEPHRIWLFLKKTTSLGPRPLPPTPDGGMGTRLDGHMLLLSLLGSAALSRTHRSRCGLHGAVAAFTLCLLFRLCARLLALFPHSHPSQFLPFWHCDNETASTATALRTINLHKCTQFFCKQDILIAFLSGMDV